MQNFLAEIPAPIRAALCARLAANADGILETLATENGISLRDVIACLPESMRAFAPGDAAQAILLDIAEWGSVTVLVHNADVILECKGPLPAGRIAHGYYNIGAGSPVSGHLKLEHCASIAFVRRRFMGADSCSVNFFNHAGEAMFKVFVGRDAQRALLADQLERYGQLQARHCAEWTA